MRWKLVTVWVLALVSTTFVTWQVVNIADSRVSVRPVEVALAQPQSTTTTSFDTATTSTTPGTSPTSTADSSTSTPPPPSTSSSTPTTTVVVEWSVRTINTSAGTVVVRYRPDEVELQAATPAPGFDVEIDDAGPEKVRAEFESEDNKVRVEVEWSDDALEVQISEN